MPRRTLGENEIRMNDVIIVVENGKMHVAVLLRYDHPSPPLQAISYF